MHIKILVTKFCIIILIRTFKIKATSNLYDFSEDPVVLLMYMEEYKEVPNLYKGERGLFGYLLIIYSLQCMITCLI